MIKQYTCVFLLLIPSLCSADELSEALNRLGFIEKAPPAVGSEEWRQANHSYPAYIVEYDGKLTIRKPADNKSRRLTPTFEAENVKYIGIDHGEFGGGLYLNEYTNNAEPFFPGNIRALIPVDKDLYIIEGLAHLVLNNGSIHVIRDYENPSTPERITLLPNAPEIAFVDNTDGDTRIVIVGHNNLMLFMPDDYLDVVFHDTFWGGLYPSSIVKYGDYYLIGIRSGVAAFKEDIFGRNKIRYFMEK